MISVLTSYKLPLEYRGVVGCQVGVAVMGWLGVLSEAGVQGTRTPLSPANYLFWVIIEQY